MNELSASDAQQRMTLVDCRKHLRAIRELGLSVKPWTVVSSGEQAGSWALAYVRQTTMLNSQKWDRKRDHDNLKKRLKRKERREQENTQSHRRKKRQNNQSEQ